MKLNLPKQRLSSAVHISSAMLEIFGPLLLSIPPGAPGAVRYVNGDSASPLPPYTTWTTAARVIQDAVDAAVAGDEIVVANGTYASGGRGVGTNLLVTRVVVEKPLALRSANGPEFTVIQGYQLPGVTNGEEAIRCVYLADGASLSGFTLANGATRTNADYPGWDVNAGGVWCESKNAILTNCVLTGNSAAGYGGGNWEGTLWNCTLTGNTATHGGGACGSAMNNCTLVGNSAAQAGGGVFCGTLSNCTLSGNSAFRGGGASGSIVPVFGRAPSALSNCTLTNNRAQYGGGAYAGDLWRCTVSSNSALQSGGGVFYSRLTNCTLTGNSAAHDAGGAYGSTLAGCLLTGNSAMGEGGGLAGGTQHNCTLTGNSAAIGGGAAWASLNNSIVYFNMAALGTNYDSLSTLNYCCTTPLPVGGVGNVAWDPQLASASHLSATSPCSRAGSAAYLTEADIDGEPWDNPPSMGCDEYHAEAVTGPLSVGIRAAFSYVAVGFPVSFTALIEGRTTGSVWEFGDGVVVTNQPWTSYAWTSPGDYPVVLRAYNESHPQGLTATQTVHVITDSIYDPLVAEMIGGIGQPELVKLMRQLTGEEAVRIGEQFYTISNRCTTSGEPIEKATQFAFEQLQTVGLQVQYQAWAEPYRYSEEICTNRNVIGIQQGAGRSNELVVIGAHLDDRSSENWAPGADDNASGSAAVLTAARILSQYRFDRSLHFILFTGEEQFLLGSTHYTTDAAQGGSNIVAALVADMIGWRPPSPPFSSVYVWGFEGQPPSVNTWMAGWFKNVVANYGLGGRLGQPRVGILERITSDQDEFWSVGFPAILVYTPKGEAIHTADDTLATLDFDYFQATVQAIVGTAAHLAGPIERNPVRQPVLGPVVVVSGGAVELTLTGLPGRAYAIEVSTDLAHWLTITNLALTATTGQFLDISTTNFPRRFYRALVQ